jgi:hypothetical protein
LMDRTPRRYEARIAVKAGTAAARKADHERETIAGRVPHLDVLDRSDNAAELQGAPQKILGPKDSRAMRALIGTRSSRWSSFRAIWARHCRYPTSAPDTAAKEPAIRDGPRSREEKCLMPVTAIKS